MIYLLSPLLKRIRHLLASRAEHKRLKEIRKALQSYGLRRGFNRNNNNKGNL